MNSDLRELKRQAARQWKEYGEAARKAYNLRDDVFARPLLGVWDTNDRRRLQAFIELCQDETNAILV